MSLFEVEAVMPPPCRPYHPADDLDGVDLREEFTLQTKAAAAATGKEPEEVLARLLRNFRLKALRGADQHDLREGIREFETWVVKPARFRTPAQRVRVQRPEGMAQLPLPRTVKSAAADVACGLCADVVPAGQPIGRMKPPKEREFMPMGWLCHHCAFERRAVPRRRDVLLRMFHHLFAASGIEFNGHEAQVLVDWLTSDPAVASSEAWQRDPLDNTLVRLRTSVAEAKPATWLSAQTGLTILAALQHAPGEPSDAELLRIIDRHTQDWQTNPQNIEHRRYGTGIRFRRTVLAHTPDPTVLSECGGPFDLHHAPPPVAEDEEGEALDQAVTADS